MSTTMEAESEVEVDVTSGTQQEVFPQESLSTALVVCEPHSSGEPDALVVLEEIQTKLASITMVNEAKELADQAGALRDYAMRARRTRTVQNHCAFVKVLAERRAGELLLEVELLRGRPKKDSSTRRLIKDFGINYNQSAFWQRLTTVSVDVLAGWRQHCDDNQEEFTSAYVALAAASPESPLICLQ